MKTYIRETIELIDVPEETYYMLIDFLEDNKIKFTEKDGEQYTIDERSDDEKYDDWLWTLGERHYEEKRMNEIEDI